LQAVASIITPGPGFKIQDSRSQKNFLNPGGVDSRFKIFRAFLESQGPGFKIQGSRTKKNFLNPGGADSRFKIFRGFS